MLSKENLIGHRGLRGLYPENTLVGLSKCIDAGLAGVEFDVQLSADGTPFIYHNLALNPSITKRHNYWLPAKARIWFNELKDCDIAELTVGQRRWLSWYRLRFWRQVMLNNAPIPSLENWLNYPNPNPDFMYLVEIKSRPNHWQNAPDPTYQAERILAVLKQFPHRKIVVESFDWRVVFAMRQMAPHLNYCLLTYAQGGSDDNVRGGGWTAPFRLADYNSLVEMVADTGIKHWAPYYKDIDAQQVVAALEQGLSVLPWTVNRRTVAKRLINLGCQQVISDYPEVFIASGKRNNGISHI